MVSLWPSAGASRKRIESHACLTVCAKRNSTVDERDTPVLHSISDIHALPSRIALLEENNVKVYSANDKQL